MCSSSYNVDALISYQHKLAPARLKKGTAQSFRLDNLARTYINLSWYDTTSRDVTYTWGNIDVNLIKCKNRIKNPSHIIDMYKILTAEKTNKNSHIFLNILNTVLVRPLLS